MSHPNKISNVIKILLVAVVLSLVGFGVMQVSANPIEQNFTDVHSSFWAKDEVTQLVDLKIINGYPDKQFRPSVEVTRGQAANLMTSALKLPIPDYRPIFSDISSKSSYLNGAMATYEAGIFGGKENGAFGGGDFLTREQMASVIVRAFELKDTGEEILFKDESRISESHKYGVKVLAQHGITTGKEDGTFDPKTAVNRATYVVLLHRAMLQSGLIEEQSEITFKTPVTYGDYAPVRHGQEFVEVPVSSTAKTFLRSNNYMQKIGEKTVPHPHGTDQVYSYSISGYPSVVVTVTKRELPNNDYFLFTELKNPQRLPVTVDIVQTESGLSTTSLVRFDRNKIKKDVDETFGFDIMTYPTGLFERTASNGEKSQSMIGQSYRSKELNQSYSGGAISRTRELFEETEAFSGSQLGESQVTVYRLKSRGLDIVDQWFLASESQLFENKKNLDAWMLESTINYKKRNKWYTANGPYNKMAITIEPLPKSGRGYGRNLLLVKEDRVLVLYNETNERYFESILLNSFANLDIYKGKSTYWDTEVTSTYLKNLYGITAPFVDTRFNEQIALFLYNSGKLFGHKDYHVALKQYADLLVSQKAKGNVNIVDNTSFYISDYFPGVQKVKTHTSMNHLLGGMNILLLAHKEFGNENYLKTAMSIQTALQKDKKRWIRPDGDLWYKISPTREFIGRDYVHLTLEDLIQSYELWSTIDTKQLPLIEELMRSKASYMDKNKKGYTTKIKNGLKRIDKLDILPAGNEHLDAL